MVLGTVSWGPWGPNRHLEGLDQGFLFRVLMRDSASGGEVRKYGWDKIMVLKS